MSRTILNFILDAVLLGTFTSLCATALIVRFVFPPGTQADGWLLWGSGYDAWIGLLLNLLAGLALLVLLHVMLHWSWVCGVVAQRLSKRLGRTVRIDEANQTLYGVGLLVVLLVVTGTFVAAAAWSIVESSAVERVEQNGQVGTASVSGDA